MPGIIKFCKAVYSQVYHTFWAYKKLQQIEYAQKEIPKNKTVVFNAVRSLHVHRVEFFLGHLLARKGFIVKILVDDGVLLHWDADQIHQEQIVYSPFKAPLRKRWLAKVEFTLWQRCFRHKNLEFVHYSDIINENELVDCLDASDKDQAVSSLKRFFEDGTFDESNEAQQKYYQRSLQNCRISKTVGKYVMEVFKPSLFITSHGIYSTWGPCYHYVKKRGIKTLVYEVHVHHKQKIVLLDTIFQYLSEDRDWHQFRHTCLTRNMEQQVDQVFADRFSHRAFDTDIFFQEFQERRLSTNGTGNQQTGLVFGMFPNVVWDGDLAERNTHFESLIEWAEYTIDQIRNTHHRLYIRFHPAESTMMSGSKSLQQLLIERNPCLVNYDNIIMLPSDQACDTYHLAKSNIDIALLYSGTLALELTYLGIPVISCSNSFYKHGDFTFEIDGIDQYETYLNNPAKVIAAFNMNKKRIKENLYRFAYWYFIKAAYEMPILDPDKLFRVNFSKIKDTARIDPAHNPHLNRTVEKVLSAIE